MAFIAMSQNLNMGGTEVGAVVGPGGIRTWMLLGIGRMITWGILAQQLLRWWM